MNILAFWAAVVVLALSILGLTALSKRRKVWYKVQLANPEMSEENVYRTGWDKLWHSDEAGMMVFHDVEGKEIRIGKHWIIKMVEKR